MKGSITDYRIRVKPSIKLIDFIVSLEDENLMPLNVLKIIQAHSPYEIKREILDVSTINLKDITDEQLKFLKTIDDNCNENGISNHVKTKLSNKNKENINCNNFNETINIDKENTVNDDRNKIKNNKKHNEINSSKLNNDKSTKTDNNKNELYLELNDLKWIKEIADEKRKIHSDIGYLHELLENCEIILPKNEIIPRNPELEKRIEKLKAEHNAKLYREMTKNIDGTYKEEKDESIGYQVKLINRQLIAVLQFVFSVAAGFAFGFIGIELIVGYLDFGFRLLLGVICGLIVALSEIYFLAKKLNEYEDILT